VGVCGDEDASGGAGRSSDLEIMRSARAAGTARVGEQARVLTSDLKVERDDLKGQARRSQRCQSTELVRSRGPSGGRKFRAMALKHRVADASYWVYGRARHTTAFESAAQRGTAADFAGLKGHKYALLVTFRKDGTAVPTPVWFVLLNDRRFVTHTEGRTAKVRRIRRDPQVRVFPCDPRGKPLGPGVEGTARILDDREDCQRAEAALDRRYGRMRRIYEKLMAPKEGMVYLEVAPVDTVPAPE
jgi:PPOX class probable F420-dependent enzyme